MRVLYVIDSVGFGGGAEEALTALVPCYRDRDIDLTVAYLRERPSRRSVFEQAGVELVSLVGAGGRVGWARRLRGVLTEHRPDLIHTTLFEADLVGRAVGALARVPVVSTLANVAYGREQIVEGGLPVVKARLAQLVDVVTARAVTRFHAPSEYVADVMSHRLLVHRSRIDVVPRGRDPELLGHRTTGRRAAARRGLGVTGQEHLVVAAARQERQKGLDVLLDGFAHVRENVPATRLVIAGREGSHTPELLRMHERLELQDSVRFLGARDDIPDLLCAADVFVAPSRWEGFCGVLLEAMALEAPIIASDLPAIRETLGDVSCARLVPRARPDILAEQIVEVLRDPTSSTKRTRSARSRFLEHFRIDVVAGQMEAFYRLACATR